MYSAAQIYLSQTIPVRREAENELERLTKCDILPWQHDAGCHSLSRGSVSDAERIMKKMLSLSQICMKAIDRIERFQNVSKTAQIANRQAHST